MSVIKLQLLGRFMVSTFHSDATDFKFRSRTAEKLLALLAVKPDRGFLRTEIQEMLWPESDGDRQSQNLRRAIADIRQVLNPITYPIDCLDVRQDWICIQPSTVETDIDRFRECSSAGLEGIDGGQNLLNAIDLYQGALLPEFSEPWMRVFREELEEQFGQCVRNYISDLLREERFDEALRIGKKALMVAPLREDIHMSLIRAYASAGLRIEAIRQFEGMETLLDETWGESPSPESIQEFQTLWPQQVVQQHTNPDVVTSSYETSGGAIPVGSPFYVRRECDDQLQSAVKRSEGTILVYGPRQVGKTSLLARAFELNREAGTQVVISDFQLLSKSQLESANAFNQSLAHSFALQLGLPVDIRENWLDWIGPNSNLHLHIETILNKAEGTVVWAIDEADRIFGTEFADDFFGLIRSWHNLRAMDTRSPFRRLSLVISYATEAHLFIKDLNQSPFNVGFRINIRDFSVEQTLDVASRYGLNLKLSDACALQRCTGGQPFLTRKLIESILFGSISLIQLDEYQILGQGPFSDHLRRLLNSLERDDAMRHEVRRYLEGRPFDDPKTPIRLVSSGVMNRTNNGEYEFRVPIYRTYLEEFLTS